MAYEIPIFDFTQEATTAQVIQYRVVQVSGAGIKHTTAVPATARPIGVAQEALAAGNSGRGVSIRAYGITKVEASTAALARGVYVSPTSGAASTGTQLGGTVKATTVIGNSMGVALTSAAAAAAGNKRYVSVLLFR